MTEQRSGRARARLSRRRFVALTAGTLIGGTPALVTAASAPRRLAFRHLHTGEALDVTYWHDGGYVDGALSEIDHLLRDFRTGEISAIDRGLLDVLHRLRVVLDARAPFEIISGYRSPRTNEMLRSRSSGVAKRSLHMDGRAIDVRLTGTSTRLLRRAAAELRAGGVGYYPKSNFVHLDTGRPRTWG